MSDDEFTELFEHMAAQRMEDLLDDSLQVGRQVSTRSRALYGTGVLKRKCDDGVSWVVAFDGGYTVILSAEELKVIRGET